MNTHTHSYLEPSSEDSLHLQDNTSHDTAREERLREPSEDRFAHELELLKERDRGAKPKGWALSPKAVLTYLMGGQLDGGSEVSPKFIGAQGLMEVAISTLATDRALLLVGVPGTGKSWVSEHLAAAISGDSSLLVQGTAGCGEESIRYGWNYAELLSRGPRYEALVESPILRAMRQGQLARVEELTRLPQAIQDALITILSEKMLPIPELGEVCFAQRGFGLIATANHQDQGVNSLSSALRRRFNVVTLPTPTSVEEELKVVQLGVRGASPSWELAREVITVFRDLRGDGAMRGHQDVKHSGRNLSPADATAVVEQVGAMCHYFRGDQLERALAEALYDAVVKEDARDADAWERYVKQHLARRSNWEGLSDSCLKVIRERGV